MAARKKTAKTRKVAKAPAKKAAAKKTVRKAAKKAPAKAKAKAKAKPKTKAKKSVRKVKSARKAPASKAASMSLPSSPIAKKQTKAQIYAEIAEITSLSKPEVKKVFAALRNLVERHVKPKGSGDFTIPELGVKIRRVNKKATKARMGRNPFTGEAIKIAAKPARKSVKATALKGLKEII